MSETKDKPEERASARPEADRDSRRELESIRARELRILRGVNHDLKNPLGAVDGYAQLLLEGLKGELTEGQRELIRRMREATAAALRLADDMSQLAILESGRALVNPSRVDVIAVLEEIAAARQAWAAREAITLQLPGETELPLIRTDPAHLRTIFDGLLRHAIAQAGQNGRVQVHADVESYGDAGGVRLIVDDTGPQVGADDADKLFEPFSRLDSNLPRGGAMELTLARASARLLGGDLLVSRPAADWANMRIEARIPAVNRAHDHRT